MSQEIELKQQICGFTLELCEECSERKIVNHEILCSFSLEPCSYNVAHNVHGAKIQTESRCNVMQVYFEPLSKSLITTIHQ